MGSGKTKGLLLALFRDLFLSLSLLLPGKGVDTVMKKGEQIVSLLLSSRVINES